MKLPAFRCGDTWKVTFAWKSNNQPINLAGCTAKMQIRNKKRGDLLAEVTTSNGITINGSAGTVSVTFPASMTIGIEPGVHDTNVQVTFPGSGEVQSSTVIDIPVLAAVTR